MNTHKERAEYFTKAATMVGGYEGWCQKALEENRVITKSMNMNIWRTIRVKLAQRKADKVYQEAMSGFKELIKELETHLNAFREVEEITKKEHEGFIHHCLRLTYLVRSELANIMAVHNHLRFATNQYELKFGKLKKEHQGIAHLIGMKTRGDN